MAGLTTAMKKTKLRKALGRDGVFKEFFYNDILLNGHILNDLKKCSHS